MFHSRKIILAFLFAGYILPMYQCKYYFVVQNEVKHDKAKDACTLRGIGWRANGVVARQCDPYNLATMPFNKNWNNKFIWIDKVPSSCSPGNCLALSVNSSETRNVSLVCIPCGRESLVMCESDNKPSSQYMLVDIVRDPNDAICHIDWVRQGTNEFLVVMERMPFKFATMYCVARLSGTGLMDIKYTRSNIGFLNLPSAPFFWIATPLPGNSTYAHYMLVNGTVAVNKSYLLSESICQRENHPPSSQRIQNATKPMSTATTRVSTSPAFTTAAATLFTSPTPLSTTPIPSSTSPTGPSTNQTTRSTTPAIPSKTQTTPSTTSTTPSTTQLPPSTPSTTTPTLSTPSTTRTIPSSPSTTPSTTQIPPSTPSTTPSTTYTPLSSPSTALSPTLQPMTDLTTLAKTTGSQTTPIGKVNSSNTYPVSTTTRSNVMLVASQDVEWTRYRFNEYYVNLNELAFEESQRFCKEQLNATLVFFYTPGLYIRIAREGLLNISSGSLWVASDSNSSDTTCFKVEVDNYDAVLYGLDIDCKENRGSICARALQLNSTEDLIAEVMKDPEFMHMIEGMTIRKNSTKKHLRRYVSVRDKSAEQAGTAVSVVVMVSSFAFFVMCDISRIKDAMQRKCKNKQVKTKRRGRKESEA